MLFIFCNSIFTVPTRKCKKCEREETLDQYHERFSHFCQHVERTICNKCIHNQVKLLLESSSKKLTEFNCPEANCKAKLNLKQIRQLLNIHPTISTKDNRQPKTHHFNERKTEFIHCAHDQCGSGQFYVFNENTPPIVNCILCKRQTCAVHHVQWHKGLTCTQYDQQQFILKTVKICSRCRTEMKRELNDESIQCRNCRFEYCFDCLVDYKKIRKNGRQFHKPTCPNYQPKPEKQSSKSSACVLL